MRERQNMSKTRKSGLLLHITSLPNRFTIGDLGSCAYRFVDFLYQSKQKLWQILPLGPTTPYGSPYMPYSAFAGNYNLISPEKLVMSNLLSETDLTHSCTNLDIWKRQLLTTAYQNFKTKQSDILCREYSEYCKLNAQWLDDFALYMSLKEYFNNAPWIKWPTAISQRKPDAVKYWLQKLTTQIAEHKFIQFIFYYQWQSLKKYAHSKQITLIGDLPLFVAYDSADVWTHPHLFRLDEQKIPLAVAGVPPDYFSEAGQLWGNPIYNWQAHQKENFWWWIDRCTTLLKLVDIIRIDHFRGLESYWQVPYGEKTAVNGEWRSSPGHELLQALKAQIGYLPFIAEDLGFINDQVIALRDYWNLPGMRVLQFAFESLEPNVHSPHEHSKHSVVYTGTHDNNTTCGWYHNAGPDIQDYTRRYIGTDSSDIAWDFIRLALASPAHLAIIPLQDVLSLDSASRMNTPGTATGNWHWRCRTQDLTAETAHRLAELTTIYGR